jgi:Lrp/AsnC family leucine-responsive transcriptional regulator
MEIDETDRAILNALQRNARVSNAEIARQVGLVPSAIFQRIRKLEERGIVRGYRCELDGRALGQGLVAFIMVRTREHPIDADTGMRLADIPEVQEVHRSVGEDCYVMKVRVRDTDDLAALLEERIRTIPAVSNTRTTIVVKTIKETIDLALTDGTIVPPQGAV